MHLFLNFKAMFKSFLLDLGYPERCHNHCFKTYCLRLDYIIIYSGCLPFRRKLWLSYIWEREKMWLSSIQKNILCYLPFEKSWGQLPFAEILGCLPLKKLRSSSNNKIIKVVFHILSSWVVIMLVGLWQLYTLPVWSINPYFIFALVTSMFNFTFKVNKFVKYITMSPAVYNLSDKNYR